jgi:hypothetical protein
MMLYDLLFVAISILATLILNDAGLPLINSFLTIVGLDVVFILSILSFLLITTKDDREVWLMIRQGLKDSWQEYKEILNNTNKRK